MAVNIGVNIQRSANRIAQAVRESAVGGAYPDLLIDVDDAYFRANGGSKAFSEVVTHSRSGNATMVDSDGLLKWAPHNLVTYSEDLSREWTTTNGAVKASTTETDPDGGNTAALITNLQSALFARITRTISTTEDSTFGVFLKGTDGETITIEIDAGAQQVTLTDAWQLYEVSDSGAASILRIINRIGDTADEVYFAFPHVYRSDLGGMVDNPDRGDSYVPTTSSAVYLPRRGHHVYNGSAWVNEGLLHESEARSNLVAYSNSPTIANGRLSSTGASAPDGSNSADFWVTTGVTGQPYLYPQAAISSGTKYTASVFVKQNTTAPSFNIRYVELWSQTTFPSASLIVDLQEGVFVSESGSEGYSIQAFPNGWLRISLTNTATSSASSGFSFILWPLTNSTGTRLDNSSGLSGYSVFETFGWQIEAGPTPSSYIPTAGATVTRAAETLTIPSANLPWPTPQVIGPELVTNGTFDTDLSGWSESGGSGDWSWSAGRAKDSGTNPITLDQTVTTVVGKVYLLSATAYNVSGGNPVVNIDGSVFYQWSSGTSELSISKAFVATSTSTLISFSGTLALWEIDNISVREINPLSVSIQMDGRVTYADTDNPNEVQHYAWGGPTTGDRIVARTATNSTKTGDPFFDQNEGSNFDFVTGADDYYTPGILVPFNIASRHGSTFINGAVDGVALTADTTPTALPDLSSTDLSLGYDMMGTIKTFRIWDKDLGDTGIEEATAPSLEPSLELVFDGSESSFVVLDWEQ